MEMNLVRVENTALYLNRVFKLYRWTKIGNQLSTNTVGWNYIGDHPPLIVSNPENLRKNSFVFITFFLRFLTRRRDLKTDVQHIRVCTVYYVEL